MDDGSRPLSTEATEANGATNADDRFLQCPARGDLAWRQHGTRYEAGRARTNARRKPRDQWLAFIPGTHEGYIEWARFERIQDAIRRNLSGTSRSIGAAREGQALVAGLLRCRRCASKLTVHYTGQHHDVARYACHRAWLDKGEPRCIRSYGSSSARVCESAPSASAS